MEYKLEFRPTERKPGVTYKNILLTDITFHTNPKRPSTFLGKIKKAFDRLGSLGRIYQPLQKPDIKQEIPGTVEFSVLDYLKNDPDFIKYVEEERQKGVEIVVQIPKAGLPVLLGKDTKEFMESIRGKRILRRLAKGKPLGV